MLRGRLPRIIPACSWCLSSMKCPGGRSILGPEEGDWAGEGPRHIWEGMNSPGLVSPSVPPWEVPKGKRGRGPSSIPIRILPGMEDLGPLKPP